MDPRCARRARFHPVRRAVPQRGRRFAAVTESVRAEGHAHEPAASPWHAVLSAARPSLRGDVTADVVIVGGGYTGLSTALAMREEGRSVVLLEAKFCGFGASGRNAGHLTPTIGKDVPTLLKLFGKEKTARFVALADTAMSEVERLMSVHSIDCHYEPVGNVIAAVH